MKARLVVLLLLLSVSFSAMTSPPDTVAGSTFYVGWGGPGNYTTIREAINVTSPGDTVYVHSGSYHESLTIYKSIALIGEGPESTIISADGPIEIYGDLVTITGFGIEDNGVRFIDATNCRISNSTIAWRDHGIWVKDSRNITIENNTISSLSDESAVYLDLSVSVTLTGNSMSNMGLGIRGTSLEHWNTHEIESSNVVNGKPLYYWKNANGGNVPPDAGQVFLVNCTNVVVENLNINGGYAGIHVFFSSNNTISNNSVSFVEWRAVFLYNSSYNTLANNNVSMNGNIAIHLESSNHNTIADNEVWGNSKSGIHLTGSSHNSVTGNRVSGNYGGILAFLSSNNNTIAENTCSDNEGTGIRLGNSQYNTITGNTVHSNGFSGLSLRDSDTNWIEENSVHFNHYGVYVNASDRNVIDNNTFSSNSGDGIFVDASEHNTISGNMVSTSGRNGIFLNDSSFNTIVNNTISHNEGSGIRLKASNLNILLENTLVGNGGDNGQGFTWLWAVAPFVVLVVIAAVAFVVIRMRKKKEPEGPSGLHM